MTTGTSSMMTGMPGGATSKGSADSKTGAAKRSEMRNASVRARCDLYGAESEEKASGGAYTHVAGEDRHESALSLFLRASSNAETQILLGEPWLKAKFNDAGMAQELLGLEKGHHYVRIDSVEKDIKAKLLSKSILEMNKDDLRYLKDKFGQLGLNMGDDQGNDRLLSAITNFLSDKPSFEQQVVAKGPVLRPN